MFYGWPLFYVHYAYTETAAAAMSVWTILFLIKSDKFQNKKYSLLFGLFFGLGLLTRWVTGLFVLGPFLYVIYQMVKEKLFKKKNVLIYTIFSLILGLVLSFYPYLINASWVFTYFNGHRFGGPMWKIVPQQERSPLTWYSLTFYLVSFEQLGIVFFLLLVAGIILAFRKKSMLKLILFAVIIPWILFSFGSILKADRFIIPIYPYLAILSASVFDVIKRKFYKNSLIVIVVILSVGTFFGAMWGKGPMKADRYAINLPFINTKIHLTTIANPPDIYKKSGKEIVDYINEDSKKNHIREPKVIALFSYRPLDQPMYTYDSYDHAKPLHINNFVGSTITDPSAQSEYLINRELGNTDYLLVKTGKQIDNYFPKNNYEVLHSLISLFKENQDLQNSFEKKTTIWIFQDSSEVTIYKKKNTLSQDQKRLIQDKLVEILKKNK